MAVCKNCEAHYRPHHMCLNCGFYKGRVVLDLAAKKKDRDARITAKHDARGGQAPVTQEEEKAEAVK